MKKTSILFTLILLITAGHSLTAQQRFSDLKAAFYDFPDTLIMDNGASLQLLPSVANLGPDTLKSTDTLFFFGNAIGVAESTPMPITLSNSTAPTYVSLITFQGYEYLINNKLSSSDSTFELCFGVYTRNIITPQANTPMKDTLPGNNKKCIRVTFKGKTVGIEDHQNTVEQLSIYPNPAGARVFVEWTAISGNTDVRIMDLSGRTLRQKHFGVMNAGKQKLSLDLQGLTSGLYLIEIQNGNARTTKKLSIK